MVSWFISMLVVISIVMPARRYFTGWLRYALSLCVDSGGNALSCRSEIALSVATCLATSRLATGVLPETSLVTTPVETWRSGY
ncbi:hypothetical protein [Enterobacter hormaechei]|uniref:hypothetical protein n=1 Tax=Enterobacter hormaechei TaxID=158836 RepID=UPI00187FB454|nr:hypothetical protein [Enterobacter hormaechei]